MWECAHTHSLKNILLYCFLLMKIDDGGHEMQKIQRIYNFLFNIIFSKNWTRGQGGIIEYETFHYSLTESCPTCFGQCPVSFIDKNEHYCFLCICYHTCVNSDIFCRFLKVNSDKYMQKLISGQYFDNFIVLSHEIPFCLELH